MLLLLLAALALWGSSTLTWVEQRFQTAFSGVVNTSGTGAQAQPELGPLALAVLTAIAAVLATSGWLRRVLGVLVTAGGGLLAWLSTAWVSGRAVSGIPPQSAGTPVGPPSVHAFGPALALVAAVLVASAGLVVVLREARIPAMGAKYSAPGTRREKPRDPDKQLWEALDEGRDPTDDADGSA